MLFVKRSILNVSYYFFVASLLFLLSGCASSWSAKVSTYQRWPENGLGESYRIEPTANQMGHLEYESVADSVRAAIGVTGLVEAQQGARFIVHLNYGSELKEEWVQRYNDPFFDGIGAFSPWGGYYGGFGGGIYYSPRVVTVPVQYQEYRLTVVINDTRQDNAEVYRATAVSMDGGTSLLDVISKLAQAVFDRFPGNNGEVHTVSYPRKH